MGSGTSPNPLNEERCDQFTTDSVTDLTDVCHIREETHTFVCARILGALMFPIVADTVFLLVD